MTDLDVQADIPGGACMKTEVVCTGSGCMHGGRRQRHRASGGQRPGHAGTVHICSVVRTTLSSCACMPNKILNHTPYLQQVYVQDRYVFWLSFDASLLHSIYTVATKNPFGRSRAKQLPRSVISPSPFVGVTARFDVSTDPW